MQKKTLLLSAFAVTIVFFGGCKLFGGDAAFMPEAAVPKDAKVVAVLDHTNDDQIDQLDELIKRFPWQRENLKTLEEKLDKAIKEKFGEDITWKENFKPLLESKWKAAFWGENLLEMQALNKNADINLAIQLEDPDEFEILVDRVAKPQLVEENLSDAMKGWEIEESELKIVRYDDLFWFTKEDVMKVKERVDNKDGFNTNEAILNRIKNMKEKNIGYLYTEERMEKIKERDVFSTNTLKAMRQTSNKLAENLKDLVDVYYIDDEGIRVLQEAVISDPEASEIKSMKEYKMLLAQQIPANGVVFYVEGDSFGGIFDIITASVEGEGVEIAKTLGVQEEDLKAITNSPFAIALYDTGVVLPAGAMYFHIDKNDSEMAKKFTEEMDKFADSMLTEFNKEIEEESGGKNAMKREVIPVNGQALRKISLDWSLIPVEKQLQYGAAMGTNINDVMVNFYYGMIFEETFVFGLYPALEKQYGKDTIAESEIFKNMSKDLDGEMNLYMYGGLSDVLGYFNRFMVRFKALLTGQQDDTFGLIEDIVAAVRTFNYVVAGAYVSSDGKYLITETFVKVERLKEEKVKR